jgi:hypothetical protein
MFNGILNGADVGKRTDRPTKPANELLEASRE